MSRPLPTGKLPPELLQSLLRSGPPLPAEIRVGPAVGEDACAIDLPAGTLVAATDPITLTGSGVGAHAVVINANDVAVMGVRPRWFLAAVLLPVGTSEDDVRALFASTRAALETVGASLVGGHTEITDAVVRPVVVGQMLGFAEDGHVVATGGARPGDAIVQVGAAPIEAAAVLAAEAGPRLTGLDPALLLRARSAASDPGVSVVEAALAATALGATALHDPTEGGLATGLQELASASGLQIRLTTAPRWFEPGLAVCERLGADPWGALASGCLLAAFPGEGADAACRALASGGFDASAIGAATSGAGVLRADGSPVPVFPVDEVARVLAA
jgi:hydrogenase expression/formation protein HypE